MTHRDRTLIALRRWGQPVSSSELARWMGEPTQAVHNSLTALYARDLCNRKANHPAGYPWRYLYTAKRIDA